MADAIDAVLSDLESQVERIHAMPSGPERADAIRRVGLTLERIGKLVTEIRTEEITRIYDEGKLALAHLAEQVGVSKARAGQVTQKLDRERKEARDG